MATLRRPEVTRYYLMVRHSRNALALHRPNGRFIYVNPSYTKLTGYTLSELHGHTPQELQALMVHPEDSLHGPVQRLMAGEESVVEEYRLRRKDGTYVWVETVGTRIADRTGAMRYILTSTRDITERHKQQEARRRTEEQLREAQSLAHLGSWEVDLVTNEVIWSEEFCRICGLDPETTQPNLELTFSIIHPEDREASLRALEAMRLHGVPYKLEKRIVRPDGEVRWVLTQAGVVRDPQDQPVRLIGSMLDVTERRLAEQQAVRAALEQERAQLMTRFVRDAAHEFRTPLAIINTDAYLMARQPDADKRVAKAQHIEMQVARMSRLLDMLLFMVRMDQDEMLSDFGKVDVSMVVQRAYGRVYARHANRPAQLELPTSLPPVMGSAAELEEAFTQIIDNAYRYSSPESTVRIRLAQEPDSLCLCVEDDGIGIDPQDQPYIFETFWRKDDARTLSGFGLGLAIAARVMSRHNGTIDLCSTPGQGSSFCLRLPLLNVVGGQHE